MRNHHEEHPSPAGDGLWLVLSAAGMPVCLVDSGSTIVWCNAPFTDLFDTTPAEALGRPILELIGLESHETLRTALGKVIHGTDALRQLELVVDEGCETRRDLTLSMARTHLYDGSGRVVLVVEDRTHLVQPLRSLIERKFEMARRASEGSLAGLPSRSTLEFLLASSLRRATERHIPFALLFCELEGLEEVGFHHGNAVVDEMRWIAAVRMNRVLRLHDTLSHLGGDEFVVIAEEVGNLDVARLVAHRLINAVTDSLRVKDAVARLDLKVGITLPTGNENAYRLLAPGPRDEVVRSVEPAAAAT